MFSLNKEKTLTFLMSIVYNISVVLVLSSLDVFQCNANKGWALIKSERVTNEAMMIMFAELIVLDIGVF